MQQAQLFNNHFVRVDSMGRERFGYVVRLDGTGIPMFDSVEFLHEVIDGQGRMPSVKVTPESVLKDYGCLEEADIAPYEPWIREFVRRGEENPITLMRAALIACGELALSEPDAGKDEAIKQARTDHGDKAEAWPDEALQAALELSRNEEALSIREIENRRMLAEMIAGRINSGEVGQNE